MTDDLDIIEVIARLRAMGLEWPEPADTPGPYSSPPPASWFSLPLVGLPQSHYITITGTTTISNFRTYDSVRGWREIDPSEFKPPRG